MCMSLQRDAWGCAGDMGTCTLMAALELVSVTLRTVTPVSGSISYVGGRGGHGFRTGLQCPERNAIQSSPVTKIEFVKDRLDPDSTSSPCVVDRCEHGKHEGLCGGQADVLHEEKKRCDAARKGAPRGRGFRGEREDCYRRCFPSERHQSR